MRESDRQRGTAADSVPGSFVVIQFMKGQAEGRGWLLASTSRENPNTVWPGRGASDRFVPQGREMGLQASLDMGISGWGAMGSRHICPHTVGSPCPVAIHCFP